MSSEFYDNLWRTKTFSLSPSKLIRERWVRNLISELCKNKANTRILDLGCGRGSLLKKLSCKFDRSAKLIGVDFSAAAIEINKRNFPRVQFHVRDFSAPDWWKKLPESDVVIAQEVIEHLSREDQRNFIHALKRLVTPGGYVLITTPNWASIQGLRHDGEGDEEFARRFEGQPNANLLCPEDLDQLLREMHLQPIFSQTVCPYFLGRYMSILVAYLFWLLPYRLEMILTKSGWLPARYHIVVSRN